MIDSKLPHITFPKNYNPLISSPEMKEWQYYSITDEDANEHKVLNFFKELKGIVVLINKDQSKIRIDYGWGDSILYDLINKKIIEQHLGF